MNIIIGSDTATGTGGNTSFAPLVNAVAGDSLTGVAGNTDFTLPEPEAEVWTEQAEVTTIWTKQS